MTILILCICGNTRNFWEEEPEDYGECPLCKKDLNLEENRIND